MKTNSRLNLLLFLISILIFTNCKRDEEGIDAIITISDTSLSIDENSNEDVIIGSINASTSFGEIIFSIDSQSPEGAIEINPATGEINIADASIFDFENHQTITATVSAAVEDESESANLIITINDMPETVTTSSFIIDLDENPDANISIGTVSAITDGNVDLVYNLLPDLNGNALAIDENTGELSVAKPSDFDYEINPILMAYYQAENGVVTAKDTIIINLKDITETINLAPFSTTINENPSTDQVLGTVTASSDAGATLTYSILSSEDATAFNINNTTGELSVADPIQFDFETKPKLTASYEVSNGTVRAQSTITVNLNDVAEAITASPFTATIDENPAANQVLGSVNATSSDGTSLTYSLVADGDASAFAINTSSGELTVADIAKFDFETNPTLTTIYEATNGTTTAQGSITITLNDLAEGVTANAFTVTIDENPAANQVLGKVSATTADGTSLTYSLVADGDASAFAINASSGELTVADVAQFDFETNPILTATYEVSNGTESAQGSIAVNLNDVNETITANDFTVTIDENPTASQVIGIVSASSANNATLTYSMVSGDDATAFAIDANSGELTIDDVAQFDYESKTSLTANYEVSNGTTSAQASITVNLNDVFETIIANPFEVTIDENPTNNQVLGVLSATADGAPTFTYQLLGNSPFSLDPNTGELSVANSSKFDYELNTVLSATYSVSGTASNGSLGATGTITVNLNDVFEAAPGSIPFITTWQTLTSNETIIIPTNPNYGTPVYNYTVDWGDGTIESGLNFNPTHTYALPGTYTVSITGKFAAIHISNAAIKSRLLSIEQWGNIEWRSMENAFWGCQNLSYNATDTPDLLRVRNMNYMFASSSFNGDISNWDVSLVTSMEGMFTFNTAFNQDISSWDVSNVTSMRFMLDGANAFDQNLGNWNLSSVTDMSRMLYNTNISISNYDAILNGWANGANTPSNITLGADGLTYSPTGAVGRDKLINQFNWVFDGDSPQ
ncbi:BspA family leucine-rich repeat surface protein [Marivirga arenosa]|uniref:BspA family leucine-rich repeat surface protein n=1 Tax=Marivirga arenosa TaxID=3059076 RepID=A0AA51ZWY3_9BACT|nr:BspA family leucine-rich repeat surface protein [Marivirga sp. BKB1-2]WNB18269.1 BspA family leucine-rich repeat surface protein [Marivirga sp. BKB1-2]